MRIQVLLQSKHIATLLASTPTQELTQVDVAILVALGSIALLLFYRFVERRHKILLAKLLATCVALLGLAAVVETRRVRRTAQLEEAEAAQSDSLRMAAFERDERALSVTFLPDSTRRVTQYYNNQPNTLTRVAFRICNLAADTVDAVRVRAWMWRRGHSRRISLFGADTVTSDAVLAPSQCAIAVWERYFLEVLDSVEARGTPEWRRRFQFRQLQR